MRDMPFLELRLVVGYVDIDITIRDESSLVERIFLRMSQRDELVVLLELRERKSRDPAHEAHRKFLRAREVFGNRRQFSAARSSIEPAGLDVDGVNLAPPEHAHQLVASLLQGQPAVHHVPPFPCPYRVITG